MTAKKSVTAKKPTKSSKPSLHVVPSVSHEPEIYEEAFESGYAAAEFEFAKERALTKLLKAFSSPHALPSDAANAINRILRKMEPDAALVAKHIVLECWREEAADAAE